MARTIVLRHRHFLLQNPPVNQTTMTKTDTSIKNFSTMTDTTPQILRFISIPTSWLVSQSHRRRVGFPPQPAFDDPQPAFGQLWYLRIGFTITLAAVDTIAITLSMCPPRNCAPDLPPLGTGPTHSSSALSYAPVIELEVKVLHLTWVSLPGADTGDLIQADLASA